MERFLFVRWWQVDGDILTEGACAHLLLDEAALQSRVLVVATGGHDLGAVHGEGGRFELLVACHLTPQHGKSFDVAVVEDLDDLGPFVRHAEVPFIDDEGAPEDVQDTEDG